MKICVCMYIYVYYMYVYTWGLYHGPKLQYELPSIFLGISLQGMDPARTLTEPIEKSKNGILCQPFYVALPVDKIDSSSPEPWCTFLATSIYTSISCPSEWYECIYSGCLKKKPWLLGWVCKLLNVLTQRQRPQLMESPTWGSVSWGAHGDAGTSGSAFCWNHRPLPRRVQVKDLRLLQQDRVDVYALILGGKNLSDSKIFRFSLVV